MQAQSKKQAIDPAAYELRRFIRDSKVDTRDLGVGEKWFLANYLRISTSISCEASSRLAKKTGHAKKTEQVRSS